MKKCVHVVSLFFLLSIHTTSYSLDRNMDLIKAVEQGKIEKVKSLLAQGADINSKDQYGRTGLILAVESGNVEIVQMFLDASADTEALVTYFSGGAFTALVAAICHSPSRAHIYSFHIVEALLSRGADPHAVNNRAIECAALNGDVEVAERLLAKGVGGNKQAYINALVRAAKKGYASIVAALLAKGININAEDVQGGTALSEAISNGHLEVVQLLLSKGADVNAVDKDGKSALFKIAAGASDQPVLARILLAAGADPDAPDTEGTTPIMLAETKGHFETLRLLQAAQTDMYAKTPMTVVTKPGEVWLWRPLSPVDQENVKVIIRMKAALGSGQKDLESFIAKLFPGAVGQTMNTQSALAGLLAPILQSGDKGVTPGFYEWPLHPGMAEDFIKIEKEGLSLSDGRRTGPFLLTASRGEHSFFGGTLPNGIVIILPSVHVNSDGESVIFVGTLMQLITAGNKVGQSTIPFLPESALVIGEVRFPDNVWLPVRSRLRIRGGGLKFEPAGISFLPGTRVIRT